MLVLKVLGLSIIMIALVLPFAIIKIRIDRSESSLQNTSLAIIFVMWIGMIAGLILDIV